MKGSVLGQRYELVRLIGQGGFAGVWESRDRVVGRLVALKLLNPLIVEWEGEAFQQLFLEEARAVGRLQHPHIVPLYDLGHEGTQLYMVLPLLTGGSLAQWLKQHGPAGPAEAAALLGPLAEALDYAHAAGVVHRDVKPQNIVFDSFQRPILTDFGLVKLLAETSAVSQPQISQGRTLGTAGYMAPEQIGAAQGQVGPATDVFALAAVLYEAVSGRRAFAGETSHAITHQVMYADRAELAARLPDSVPAEARNRLAEGLAVAPQARPTSAGALVRGLAEAAQATRRRARLAQVETDLAAGRWTDGLLALGAELATAPNDPRLQALRQAAEESLSRAGRERPGRTARIAISTQPERQAVYDALTRGAWEEAWQLAARLVTMHATDLEATALLDEVETIRAQVKRVEELMGQEKWDAARAAVGEVASRGYLAEQAAALSEALAGREAQWQLRTWLAAARTAMHKQDIRGALLTVGQILAQWPDNEEAAALRGHILLARQPTPHVITGKPPLYMAWCYVPYGELRMGDSNEKPIHEVSVDGFWLARYPVTNAQFKLFVDGKGYSERRWWTEAGWAWRQEKKITQPAYWTDGRWNGAQQPVVGVSWYEAAAFCAWAAEATGEPIRLPAEAEWEWAARGSDGRAYPWGDNQPANTLCNIDGTEPGKTMPVGQYSPAGDSPFGCADMAGNVREWVQSLKQAYPYRDDDGRNDPDRTGDRVLRGGSWLNLADVARAAYRYWLAPDCRFSFVGFRCASTPF